MTPSAREVLTAAHAVALDHGLVMVGSLIVDKTGDPWTIGELIRETATRLAYSEDQPRDEQGRFGEGEGGGTATQESGFQRETWAQGARDLGDQDIDKTGASVERMAAQWQLTENEVAAVADYTLIGSYDSMNDALRDGSPVPDAFTQTSRDLDSAIDKGYLSKDTILYRGVVDHDGTFADLEPGDTITDAGYMSTSFSREIPETFFSGTGEGTAITMELRTPPGPIAYADVGFDRAGYGPYVGYSVDGALDGDLVHMNEAVLPRDTTIQIDGREGNTIYGTVLR